MSRLKNLCYHLVMDKQFWIVIGFIAFYFALQLWILPAFGVPT